MLTVSVSSDGDVVFGTPTRITEFVKELHSPKNNFFTSEHRFTTLVAHSPDTDRFIVDNTFKTTYNEEPSVKRTLFKDDADP